jgi:hypothetical protein
MIKYFLGGAAVLGVGLAVTKYVIDGRYYRKFKKAIEENKRIFDLYTPEVVDKLADALVEDEKFQKLKPYLDAERLSSEGRNAIREYYKDAPTTSKEIINCLLKEIEEREKESENLGKTLEKRL